MKILKIGIVQLFIGVAFVTLCALAPGMLNKSGLFSLELSQALISAVSAILGLIGYLLYIRFIEKRLPHELSPLGSIQETAAGLALGALLAVGTIFTMRALGVLKIGPRNANPEYLKAIFSIGLIAAVI